MARFRISSRRACQCQMRTKLRPQAAKREPSGLSVRGRVNVSGEGGGEKGAGFSGGGVEDGGMETRADDEEFSVRGGHGRAADEREILGAFPEKLL